MREAIMRLINANNKNTHYDWVRGINENDPNLGKTDNPCFHWGTNYGCVGCPFFGCEYCDCDEEDYIEANPEILKK